MLKQNMTKDGMNVSFSGGSGLSAKAMNNLTAMKMKSDAYKSELAKKGETGEVDYPNTYPLTTTRNVTIALKGDANKMMHGVAGDRRKYGVFVSRQCYATHRSDCEYS